MSTDKAQQFVAAMQQDETFRQGAMKAASDQKIAVFLQNHGYAFELAHLVIAMAGCMDEMQHSQTESS